VLKSRKAWGLKHLVVALFFLGALVFPAIAAAGPTIVSLTFDDGSSDQYAVRSMLAQHSLHGTFYINSNNIGSSPAYMTWNQLSDLAADGNEIGGHTLDHVDLTAVSSTEATRQVCTDRQALISHGFTVTDFAYPFGAENTSVQSIVRGCGYSSARRAWGLCAIGVAPANCTDPWVESIPPRNLWATGTIPSIKAWNTAAEVESAVTRAEANGGGWVPLVFHHVCDGCDPDGYSVSPAVLSALLDWLEPRAASGTYVRTIRDIISDKTPPTSSIACSGAGCSSGWYASPVTVSLSATDAGTAVSAIRYTIDGSDPSTSSPLYSGPFSVSSTTTVKYRAWDVAGNVEATKSQLIQADSTIPVSSIACNGGACSSGTYTAAVSVSLSATDTGSGVAAIRYTTDGSDPSTSSPLYSGPFSVSTTTTVKYRAWDVAGNVEATNSQLIQVDTTPADTTPPTSSIACNGGACSSGTYTAAVSVSLSATDTGSGVAAIRYTTDGSDPSTSSPLYSGPFSVSTTTTVKYRAWDVAGNVEATNSQLIQVDTTPADTTPPTSSIACNGAACSSGWYAPPVNVSLSATDGGSGVAAIRYTTDGSDPSTSSPLYSGPFSVSTTTTVKYRSWDVAGNLEGTKSRLIQVDTFAPTVSITSPLNFANVTGNIKIVAAPSDAETGVASVTFYVDGALVGTVTSAPWQVPWNTKRFAAGQHVLTAVATDRAGNRRTSATVTVTVR
jgi:peptidoglycan/xylan/chitin deacetylase (PgdA/CDA1 family)